MTTNTVTITPYKAMQWNPWANWYDVAPDFVAAGASYNQDVLDGTWYASIGMNVPYFANNAIVTSVKLNVRGELPVGSSLSNGTLNMTIFNFSSSSDGQVFRSPDKSISMPANSVATFDIDSSVIEDYAYNFGVFLSFNPSQQVLNAYLLLYPSLEITYETYEALPPDTLSPNGINQNPNAPIILSWFYRNSGLPGDHQIESIMRYTIVIGEIEITNDITSFDTANAWEFEPGTLLGVDAVNWKVRALSALTGYSEWSETAAFTLAATPPLQSILIYPPNEQPVNGANGVTLEWRYNSPYDAKPSRFDIRYNLDGGEWIELSTDGQQKVTMQPILTQTKITWQVMAYGEWGDSGPWSALGTFWIVGEPGAPTVVNVTNSNRPTISFSAENLMSWELQIADNTKILYETGNQPFVNDFAHRIHEFLPNGNYIARVRTTNEYGLISEWGELAFAINTFTPEPLKLQLVSNPDFNIRLHFDNASAKIVYIYRSEFRKNDYLRIGRTNGAVFDDFTTRPSNPSSGVNARYDYFVRVIDSDDSFADSNIETGSLRFLETTLAEYDNPQNMLMLKCSTDNKPTKDISFSYEKTLTRFIGREKPVFQVGEYSDKSMPFSFYCSIANYEQLERIHKSSKALILRDWRVGVIYGTINGAVSARRETDGFQISFVFTQTDFNTEVELI